MNKNLLLPLFIGISFLMSTDIVFGDCRLLTLKEKFDNNERIFVATVKDVKKTQNAAGKDTFIYTLDVLENIKGSTNDGNFESIIDPLSYGGRISNFEYRDGIPRSFPIGSTYIIFDSHSFFFFERKGSGLYGDSCPSNKDPSLKEDSIYRDLKLIKQRSINPDWQWFYAIEEKIKPLLEMDYSIKNAAQRNIIFSQRNRLREAGKKKWYDLFVSCDEMLIDNNECSTIGYQRCIEDDQQVCRDMSSEELQTKLKAPGLCAETGGVWEDQYRYCKCPGIDYTISTTLQEYHIQRSKGYRHYRHDVQGCVDSATMCSLEGGDWKADNFTDTIVGATTIKECLDPYDDYSIYKLEIPRNDEDFDMNFHLHKTHNSGVYSGYLFRIFGDSIMNYRNSNENKCYKREYVSSDPCVGANKSNIGK